MGRGMGSIGSEIYPLCWERRVSGYIQHPTDELLERFHSAR